MELLIEPVSMACSRLTLTLVALVIVARAADAFANQRAVRSITRRWSSALSYKAGKIRISEWAEAADGEIVGTLHKAEYISNTDLLAAKDAEVIARAQALASGPEKRPMELFVDAGPGGGLGGCPVAHGARMVLAAKGVACVITPVAEEDKPTWLVSGWGGRLPCLLHAGEARTNGADIARYLEFFFPLPALALANAAAEATCAALLSALNDFMRDDAPRTRAASEEGLRTALGALEEHLAAREPNEDGHVFMAGDGLGLGDCSLAPVLFHVNVAAPLKAPGPKSAGRPFPRLTEADADFPALARYARLVLSHPAFVASACSEAAVVAKWMGSARAKPQEGATDGKKERRVT